MTMTLLDAPGVSQPLRGRSVLVTGGATGIGAAISRALALAGAFVAIHHPAQPAEAYGILEAITMEGQAAFTISADLTDPDAAAEMVNQIQAELGTVDILVNNAGACPRLPWDEITETDWARGSRCEPDGALPRVPRSHTRHDGPSLGAHRQHRKRYLPSWSARPGRLQRGQGGVARAEPLIGQRAWPVRNLRQCCPARRDPGQRGRGLTCAPSSRPRRPDPTAVHLAPRQARRCRRSCRFPSRPGGILHHRAVPARRRRMVAALTSQ